MTDSARRLRLTAVIFGLGNHEAAWRMPESQVGGSTDIDHWLELGRIAEAAGFDSLFLGDVLALLQGASKHLSDTMDPLVILSAIAAVTSRIGLIGTSSTTFDAPFHLARRFASLDHISRGRAGWNIVTSSNVLEARNFGLSDIPGHRVRYERAADVVNAVTDLWDSWADDARLNDKASGIYFDEAKVRPSEYVGSHVSTAGPLNTPRSPQGRPVLVQAGSSEDGRQLAARLADVIFTAQISLEDAVDFYDDMKARVRREGRNPDQVLVMPGFMPIVAETRGEAEDRLAQIDGVIVRDHALAQLSEYLRIDAASLDLDAPLPDHVGTNARSETNKSRFELIVKLAHQKNLTVRQLLTRVGGGRGHFLQAGTANEIADTMQQWFEAGAADGFNVMPPVLPADLKSFSALVMPELRRRGVIGDIPTDSLTLRHGLGLASV